MCDIGRENSKDASVYCFLSVLLIYLFIILQI